MDVIERVSQYIRSLKKHDVRQQLDDNNSCCVLFSFDSTTTASKTSASEDDVCVTDMLSPATPMSPTTPTSKTQIDTRPSKGQRMSHTHTHNLGIRQHCHESQTCGKPKKIWLDFVV